MDVEVKKTIIKLYSKIHKLLFFFLFFFVIYYECLIIIPDVTLSLKRFNDNLYSFLNTFRGIVDWIFIGFTYFIFKKLNDWFEEIKKSYNIYD